MHTVNMKITFLLHQINIAKKVCQLGVYIASSIDKEPINLKQFDNLTL